MRWRGKPGGDTYRIPHLSSRTKHPRVSASESMGMMRGSWDTTSLHLRLLWVAWAYTRELFRPPLPMPGGVLHRPHYPPVLSSPHKV